jgi:NAD-dependent DNA ligase
MLSLAKTYTGEGVLEWAARVARGPEELFRIGPKFDGVACEVTPGGLTTRGDGHLGEVITRKAYRVAWWGKTARTQRGELVVHKSELAGLRRETGEPYVNCRAAVAGILGLDNTEHLGPDSRPITFYPHNTETAVRSLSELPSVDWGALGWQVSLEDYPTDGLVISLVDEAYANSLGATAHHPHHSIALKHANPSGVTKLLGVTWQVGKNKITPVAVLEPVLISGCRHSRASLHGMRAIAALGLTIGSTVVVERCGNVIPQIYSVELNGRTPIEAPTECPACAAPVAAGPGGDLTCTNSSCGGMAAKRLLDALRRLGVESCGPAVVSALVGLGCLSVRSVFSMAASDWGKLPGFARLSATKMAAQFERLRLTPVNDYQILAAMNIEGVGLTLSKRVCDLVSPSGVREYPLEYVEGFGEERVNSIRAGFDDGLWEWAVQNLTVVLTKGFLSRRTVCFTGEDEMPRKDWIKLAEARGFAYAKSVTKGLDLLVTNDIARVSGKTTKARKYGIRLQTYEDFADDTR